MLPSRRAFSATSHPLTKDPWPKHLRPSKRKCPQLRTLVRTNFGTPGGPVFGADLYKGCEAAGFEVILLGFTGG